MRKIKVLKDKIGSDIWGTEVFNITQMDYIFVGGGGEVKEIEQGWYHASIYEMGDTEIGYGYARSPKQAVNNALSNFDYKVGDTV